MTRVAVLGHRGMLGSRLVSVLPRRFHVITFAHRWPDGLLDAIDVARPDWIINCISGGVLEWHDLPAELAVRFRARVIQPSTDAAGELTEYAQAKALADAEVLQRDGTVIRCGIVDPAGGLLAQIRKSSRFDADTALHWNGITALAWAGVAERVMDGDLSGLVVPGSPPTSIYQLAADACRVFGWKTDLAPRPTQGPDRVQRPTLWMPPIADQLAEYVG